MTEDEKMTVEDVQASALDKDVQASSRKEAARNLVPDPDESYADPGPDQDRHVAGGAPRQSEWDMLALCERLEKTYTAVNSGGLITAKLVGKRQKKQEGPGNIVAGVVTFVQEPNVTAVMLPVNLDNLRSCGVCSSSTATRHHPLEGALEPIR